MAKTTFTIPQMTLPTGTSSFGPFNPPNTGTDLEIDLDMSLQTNPALTVTVDFRVSYDGGNTFQAGGSSTQSGAWPKTIDGQSITVWHLDVGFDTTKPASSRRIDADVIVAGGSFTLAGGSVNVQ